MDAPVTTFTWPEVTSTGLVIDRELAFIALAIKELGAMTDSQKKYVLEFLAARFNIKFEVAPHYHGED
jgi:hypothetical protein